MLKKILALMAMLYAAACFAAVDVNKASTAELDSIKGIGPGISTKILDERKKGSFKDWSDFVERVKGVGEGNAAKFSAEGLTVNGDVFKGVAPVAKKAAAKKVDAKMPDPAKDVNADAKAEKAQAAKKAKEEKAAARAAAKASASK